MAQQVNVRLVDDVDGSEAVETVSFGLDGRVFDIDLSTDNAAQLRDALAPFVSVARRGEGARRRSTTPRSTTPRAASSGNDRDQSGAIRDWAKNNGLQVSDRGRISRSVREAYDNRGTAPATAPATPDVLDAPEGEKAPRKSRKRLKVAS